MTKEELINHYEKEFAEFNEKSDFWEKVGETTTYYWWAGRVKQIRDCIEKIKQLNEATVKRSELIDFVDYIRKNCDDKYVNIEKVVNNYLKSINSNEA
jgi:hypothetical protein